MIEPVHLAVNGTLMRGLELNPNMLAVGAELAGKNHRPPGKTARATRLGRFCSHLVAVVTLPPFARVKISGSVYGALCFHRN